MSALGPLYYVGIFSVLLSSASACGEFNFETAAIVNGTLHVKETTRVNITFTILNKNCSKVTYGDIDILKMDNTQKVFMHQCKIPQPCNDRPEVKNIYCYCLGRRGFYSLTFIADRIHNAQWKWSSKHKEVPDAILTLNVTYPANVTGIEIVGYYAYIPKIRSVSVVCTWENGNPPTRVLLLDRYNTVLVKGDTSGNISYTFSPVVCSHSGVIRCEADGSEKNASTTMLIECPPEFVRTTSITQTLNIDQNADVVFPFRSHTPNINSCHIKQMVQNMNCDTSQCLIINCSKVRLNNTGEIRHCMYYVSGQPPDLHLTIHVRNLKRNDGGLWYVNISNDEGNDALYIYVNIKADSDPAKSNGENIPSQMLSPAFGGVVFGVVGFAVIIFIIVYYVTKGKETYARLQRKRKKETALYRGLGTDTVEQPQRQSGLYYEIQDNQLETDLHATVRKLSVTMSGLFPNDHPHFSESTNDTHLKSVQSAQEDTETSKVSDESASLKLAETENPSSTSLNTLDYLQPIRTDNQTSNILKESAYRKITQTGNDTSHIQQGFEYLKLIHKRNEGNGVAEMSHYLNIIRTEWEKDADPLKSGYSTPLQTGNETNYVPEILDSTVADQSANVISNLPQTSDFLEPIQIEMKDGI